MTMSITAMMAVTMVTISVVTVTMVTVSMSVTIAVSVSMVTVIVTRVSIREWCTVSLGCHGNQYTHNGNKVEYTSVHHYVCKCM